MGVATVACDLARAATVAAGRLAAQLAAQAAACLRNLCADRASCARPLEAAGACSALAGLLRPFRGDGEVVLNAARALAKLSAHENTRRGLHGDERALLDMADALLDAHARRDDDRANAVVVRLAFCLGNLTASHDENRKVAGTRAAPLVAALAASARDFLRESQGDDQVLIKLIRLVANASIRPSAGVGVASDDGIACLPSLLREALRRDREELALNATGPRGIVLRTESRRAAAADNSAEAGAAAAAADNSAEAELAGARRGRG